MTLRDSQLHLCSVILCGCILPILDQPRGGLQDRMAPFQITLLGCILRCYCMRRLTRCSTCYVYTCIQIHSSMYSTRNRCVIGSAPDFMSRGRARINFHSNRSNCLLMQTRRVQIVSSYCLINSLIVPVQLHDESDITGSARHFSVLSREVGEKQRLPTLNASKSLTIPRFSLEHARCGTSICARILRLDADTVSAARVDGAFLFRTTVRTLGTHWAGAWSRSQNAHAGAFRGSSTDAGLVGAARNEAVA